MLAKGKRAPTTARAKSHSRTHPLALPFLSLSQCPGRECAKRGVSIRDFDPSCADCGTQFPVCVASGRVILPGASCYTCKTCRHKVYETELRGHSHCPLCHVPLE